MGSRPGGRRPPGRELPPRAREEQRKSNNVSMTDSSSTAMVYTVLMRDPPNPGLERGNPGILC